MLVSCPRDTATIYEYGNEETQECTISHVRTNKLAATVDYVLFDPHEDPLATQTIDWTFLCGKNVLLAVSPDPQYCSKVIKDAAQKATFYMGPTDLDESEAIRSACYAEWISADELKTRLENIGGIPRLLFEMKSPVEIEGYDDSAIKDIPDRHTFALNDLAENPRRIDAGSVASSFKSLWSLYHMVPVPNNLFTSYSIELCSENALGLLKRRLLEMDVNKLWDLFYNTQENLGTLRWIRFEAYALKKILVDGINLTAMKLNAASVSKTSSIAVKIPACLVKVAMKTNNVNQLAELRAQAQKMNGADLLPDLPNYLLLDSAYVSSTNECVILQIKAGRRSKPRQRKLCAQRSAACL